MGTTEIVTLAKEKLYSKTEFCCCCVAYGDNVKLAKYTIENQALLYMIQNDHLTLCNMCRKSAKNTELFLNNLLLNRSIWQNNEYNTEDILIYMKGQIKLPINLTFSKTITAEYNTNNNVFENDSKHDCFSKYEDSFSDDDIMENKPLCSLLNEIKIEGNESKYAISENIPDEMNNHQHEAFTKAIQPNVKVKAETRGPRTRKTRSIQGNNKIQHIRISREEHMLERNKMAADRKYTGAYFRCESCVKGFTFRSSYENHMKKHDVSNGEHECDICRQRVDTEEKLQRHQNLHFQRFRCSVCGSTRSSRSSVAEHQLAEHSGGQLLACPHCPKLFKRLVSRKKHVSQHHSGRARAVCAHCPKTYANKQLLKAHYASAHAAVTREPPPRLPHRCGLCGAAFAAPSFLRKHMLRHSDKRDYYCVECDRSFKSEATLKTHLRLAARHVNYMDLRFACQSCPRRFAASRDLQHHANGAHLHVKPYACDDCDKTYSNKCSLSKHKQFAHKGRRPPKQPCPVCEKLFDKRTLTNHLRTHTGERPFKCHQCPMAFNQSSILSTHVKLVHLKLRRDGSKKK